jgi:hypothetical protein
MNPIRPLTGVLAGVLLAAPLVFAQVLTPRGDDAAVYETPNMAELRIIAQVRPDGKWRLEFTGSQAAIRLPSESDAVSLTFLLPARDTGLAVLARARGPGKNNQGWVEVSRIEVSPEAEWKLPRNTVLFVPMTPRQVPRFRAAGLPPNLRVKPCSYLVMIDPEGKVLALRLLEGAPSSPFEAALSEFRFVPVRVEGESAHVLVAIRAEPRK